MKLIQIAIISVGILSGVIMTERYVSGGQGKIGKFITVPAGRFVIDVPEQAIISWGRQGYEQAGPFINSFSAQSPDVVLETLNKDSLEFDVPHLQFEKMVKGKINNSWFMYYWDNIEVKVPYIEIKGYFWKDGRGYIFKTNATYSPAGMEARADLLENIFSRLCTRSAKEIPSDPGFCIAGAYFKGEPSADPSEHIAMQVHLPSNPDVFIRFTTDTVSTFYANGPNLQDRIVENPAGPGFPFGIRRLKAAQRIVGAYRGFEVIDRARELNLTVGYSFMWEYPGIGENAKSPSILLQMMTGEGKTPVSSSLSRKQATELWNRILGSIRYRVPPGKTDPPCHKSLDQQ